MTPASVNAIAKVRFSSARAQRVHLADAGGAKVELLCLEGGQEMTLSGPSAHLLGVETDVTLTNLNEQRLICLLLHSGS